MDYMGDRSSPATAKYGGGDRRSPGLETPSSVNLHVQAASAPPVSPPRYEQSFQYGTPSVAQKYSAYNNSSPAPAFVNPAVDVSDEPMMPSSPKPHIADTHRSDGADLHPALPVSPPPEDEDEHGKTRARQRRVRQRTRQWRKGISMDWDHNGCVPPLDYTL